MTFPPEFRPQADEDSRPYWEALRRRTLLLPYCADCDRAFFYPRSICPRCHGADVTWRLSAGRGVIYAVTVVHRPPNKKLAAEAPYPVALVDLQDGCRILMRVHPDDAGAARVGAAAQVDFQVIDDELTMPVVRIASAGTEETE
jgi:uncharacterized OB-fold protein